MRGASAPLTCKECGEAGEKVPSLFTARGVEVPEAYVPPKPKKGKAKYIKRMGGGVAYQNEYGNYRPALSHIAKCPQCARDRNVAILGEFPYGKRLNCEACGYQWIHQEATASDPLREGYDSRLSPGHKHSYHVTPGDQYQHPERGV